MTDQRDAAAVRVFPPAVPAVTILMGLALQRLWPLKADLGMNRSTRHWVGGLIIAGAFFGLGGWSVILFRKSGQNENPWKPTPQIVERGPFRITRNPMYLQMIVICIGVAVILANAWILLLIPLAGGAAAPGNPPRGGVSGAEVRGHVSGLQESSSAVALECGADLRLQTRATAAVQAPTSVGVCATDHRHRGRGGSASCCGSTARCGPYLFGSATRRWKRRGCRRAPASPSALPHSTRRP